MGDIEILRRRKLIDYFKGIGENVSYSVGSGVDIRWYGSKIHHEGSSIDFPMVGVRFYGDSMNLGIEVLVNENGVIGTREIHADSLRTNLHSDLREIVERDLIKNILDEKVLALLEEDLRPAQLCFFDS